jgi:hypothetical protein
MAEGAEAAGEEDSFVEIARVWSMPEASVLLATLRAYGFAPVAMNQSTISVMPELMVGLGGVGIAVHSADVEDALALLAEIDEGWICQKPPFDDDAVVSGAASAAMTWFGGPPMPRVRGDYAWEPKPKKEL